MSKVVLLPEGEDPDSYLQKVGATAFRAYVDEQAKDFILFKTQLLLEETANDPIKRSELIQRYSGEYRIDSRSSQALPVY